MKREESGSSNNVKTDENTVSNGMVKLTRSNINKLMKTEKPNINIYLNFKNMSVDANPEVYGKDDIKRMNDIVKHMSKRIIIDRTYVQFKGNRWKDAFIVEDKWYEFLKIILSTDFGRKCSKKTNEFICETLVALAITYLYDILEKYDYDISEISIECTQKCKLLANYEIDDRTSWNQ